MKEPRQPHGWYLDRGSPPSRQPQLQRRVQIARADTKKCRGRVGRCSSLPYLLDLVFCTNVQSPFAYITFDSDILISTVLHRQSTTHMWHTHAQPALPDNHLKPLQHGQSENKFATQSRPSHKVCSGDQGSDAAVWELCSACISCDEFPLTLAPNLDRS